MLLTEYPCYVVNRVPHKKLDQTAYELCKGYAPNFSLLRMWGCLCKVSLPDFKWQNIGPKTFNFVFIGYAQNNAAYRFMSLNDFSISESRGIEIFWHAFPFKMSDSNIVHKTIHVHDSVPLSASSFVVRISVGEPRRSK